MTLFSKLSRRLFNPVQRLARTKGVMLTKYPSVALHGFPVFPILVQYLSKLKNDHVRFIHVGANDGGGGDPLSYLAVDRKWSGILVEPQPEVFDQLVKNYEKSPGTYFFENVAIAPRGKKDLVMYRAPACIAAERSYATRTNLSTSADPHVTARTAGVAIDKLEQFHIPCVTLDDLVAKHQFNELDVLLVDAEGLDAEVLMTLDMNRVAPLVVQFETVHLTGSKLDQAVDYLQSHGYRVLYLHPQYDTIAVHKSALDLFGVATE